MPMPNFSSLLRRRVTLQQPVMTADGAGGYTRTWADVATLWAQITPVLQRVESTEVFADQRLQAIMTHRVRLRYRAGVTADMRLVYKGRVLSILAVTSKEEEGIALEILAREGAG